MPEKQDSKQILDEYANDIIDNTRGKRARRRYYFSRLYRYKSLLIKIAIIAVIIFFICLFYRIIVAPPRYSDHKTEINGRKFAQSALNTGALQVKFNNAIEILREHPYFYKKVVNNIDQIIVGPGCPLMCVTHYFSRESWWDMIVSPPNRSAIPLTVNPGSLNVYGDDHRFAAALVHEADHIEYLRSSRVRKLALMLKCNPITNFRISIDSTVPSIIHRVSAMEICAQKEQIKFHKATETTSGYEIKSGIIYNFGRLLLNSFKFLFGLIFSIFKA